MKWVQSKGSGFSLGSIWKHCAETCRLRCILPSSPVGTPRLPLRCACLCLLIIAFCYRMAGIMIWNLFPISERKDQYCKHPKLGELNPTFIIFPAYKVGSTQALLFCLSALLHVSAARGRRRFSMQAGSIRQHSGACSQINLVRPGAWSCVCIGRASYGLRVRRAVQKQLNCTCREQI